MIVVFLLFMLQFVIFGVLVIVLRYVFARNVTSATSHLQDMIQDYAKKEEELKKRFDEAEKYYNQMVDRARQDTEQLKVQMIKDAQSLRDKMLEDAHTQSEQIVDRADKTSGMMRNEMRNEIETRAIEKACELVQQTLPSQLQEETHTRWTEELMKAGLEQVASLNISEDVKEVEISSAFPLKAEQRNALKKKLEEKLARNITLKENVDSRIVAGMVIKIGSLVLDGSLFYKIREAAIDAQAQGR